MCLEAFGQYVAEFLGLMDHQKELHDNSMFVQCHMSCYNQYIIIFRLNKPNQVTQAYIFNTLTVNTVFPAML